MTGQTRRDHIIEDYVWEEKYMEGKEYGGIGSGYPSGICYQYQYG